MIARRTVLKGAVAVGAGVALSGCAGDAESPSPPTQDAAADGRVLGYLIKEEAGKALVQLPGEALVGGLRTWVEKSAVTHRAR